MVVFLDTIKDKCFVFTGPANDVHCADSLHILLDTFSFSFGKIVINSVSLFFFSFFAKDLPYPTCHRSSLFCGVLSSESDGFYCLDNF